MGRRQETSVRSLSELLDDKCKLLATMESQLLKCHCYKYKMCPIADLLQPTNSTSLMLSVFLKASDGYFEI